MDEYIIIITQQHYVNPDKSDKLVPELNIFLSGLISGFTMYDCPTSFGPRDNRLIAHKT